MREMLAGLGLGLGLAVVFIFLLLAANFQSLRLALVTLSTVPAVIAGVVLMLAATGTTLNIQSLIGAIMAIGVAMANAILLGDLRRKPPPRGRAGSRGRRRRAASRLRAILMTSCAMIAGMLPMALALGEGRAATGAAGPGRRGRALAATVATLFILPGVFAIIQRRATPAPLRSTRTIRPARFSPQSTTVLPLMPE